MLLFGAMGVVALQGYINMSVMKDGNRTEMSVAVTIDEDILYFFPQAVSLNRIDTSWIEVYDKENKKAGYVMYSAPYSNNIYGFGGNTPLIIAFDQHQKIIGTKLLENNETPSYVTYVSEEGLFEQWNGLTIDAALNKEVDAISGATYTSTSVIKSFHKRMSLLNTTTNHHRDFLSVLKNVCALVVILFALFCFLKPNIMKPYRLYLLGMSVIVLGVWQGIFLSVSGVYAGLSNSIPFLSQYVFFVILILSVIIPLVTNKQFYCTWLCPFGALQELTGKLNKRKIHISLSVLKALHFMRKLILLLIVFLLMMGIVTDISYIEPFPAFKIISVSNFVLILAGFFILLSAFINRPWCRFFCPTGQLLDTFKTISFKNIRS
jgi:Na+-translocating ferredoxin:NAD+ oxidoreductase RnfG subunit